MLRRVASRRVDQRQNPKKEKSRMQVTLFASRNREERVLRARAHTHTDGRTLSKSSPPKSVVSGKSIDNARRDVRKRSRCPAVI